MSDPVQLGTPQAASSLLFDLYVELRQKLRTWSALTRQTPQARMGYVGQHLVSAVTGFQGGRSGARGRDLLLPAGEHAEIKTCYRVDQLGVCSICRAAVSAIESNCPACGSSQVERRNDSKWLIGVRSHRELIGLFDSTYFFFVLFDFVDFNHDLDIYARIWRLSPRSKAFAYCMIDYYHNIGTQSSSGAPFNLWPFKLKFDLMRAELIFQARIGQDDAIAIEVFENKVGTTSRHRLQPLTAYSRSGGSDLSVEALRAVGEHLGLELQQPTKAKLLEVLERERNTRLISDAVLADALSDVLYGARIVQHLSDIPSGVPQPTVKI